MDVIIYFSRCSGEFSLKIIATIGAWIALLFIKMVLIRQDNKFCYR